jgi:iron complex outermembrane receptor protein
LGLEAERGALSARAELRYLAKQDDVAAFELPTDDSLVLNASLGWKLTPSLTLQLEGRNLTDEEVRLSTSPLKEVAPQPGRNLRLGLRASF